MREQAERLLALGAKAVLIKGGHGSGPESVDLLVEREGSRGWPRRASRPRTRTAPAARCHRRSPPGLAKGLALAEAVRAAKAYVTAAIAAAEKSHDRVRPRTGASFSRWW